jgi:hypothetical protein
MPLGVTAPRGDEAPCVLSEGLLRWGFPGGFLTVMTVVGGWRPTDQPDRLSRQGDDMPKPKLSKGDRVMIPFRVHRITGKPVLTIPEGDRPWDYDTVEIWRETNEEDRRRWSASDESKGMTDAGETRLQSPTQYLQREEGAAPRLWVVVSARVAAPRGWGRESGCALVRDEDGVLWWVHREHCYPV